MPCLQVTDMEAGSHGTVNLTATLNESASLYDAEGRQADGYKSSYEAKYQVVQVRHGAQQTRMQQAAGCASMLLQLL